MVYRRMLSSLLFLALFSNPLVIASAFESTIDVHITGSRTTAVAAKFRSLSSRPLDMWWDDGGAGISQGRIMPGKETTTNSYDGHVFYFTDTKNKADVVDRITIKADTVLYPVRDANQPAPREALLKSDSEEAFGEEYFTRMGIKWRHYFGENGPRPPPVLNMWPGDLVGQVHRVTSLNAYWKCSGPATECQGSDPVHLLLECVSTQPRVFVVENFLSDTEADAIVSLAKPNVTTSTVGTADSGGVLTSSTRTSRNTWISRQTSPVTETITRRVADVLGLDEQILTTARNAEDMQVVHYEKGQKYDSHHDWGVSGYPESRFITVLMYLSSQESERAGGETAFPKCGSGGGIKVRPVKGTAVIFYNLLEDGNGDDLALHAALPVTKGEKWLANFWIWDPKKA